jgi:hypothetical protein
VTTIKLSFVRFEVGSTIEADELAPEKRELDGQPSAGFTSEEVTWSVIDTIDVAVGKGGGVELCGLASLAKIERDAGHQFCHK